MPVTGRERLLRLLPALAAIALPALAACSSASSPPSDTYSGTGYPSQSLVDFFKHASDSSPPANQSNCALAPTASQAGAAASTPASCPAVADNSPSPSADPVASAYPHGTTLVEMLKRLGSPAPAQPAVPVPHPPTTYTPVGEIYGTAPPAVPPPQSYPAAQPASAPANIKPAAANGAAAPPADTNLMAGVYPQQSLFDLFTKKPASQ